MKITASRRAGVMVVLAIALGMPLAAFAQPAARVPLSPEVKVKVGTFRSTVDSAPALAQSRGYFKAEGLDVEFVSFASSGDAMQALALGQIDSVPGTVNAGLFNMLARRIPLKIVGSAGDQPAGHGSVALVMRDDLVKSGRYKGPADLKGLKVSVPGRTSTAHFMLKELAAKGGLTLKDIDVVHLGLAEGLPAMANKSIDALVTVEPYVSKTVKEAPGVRVVGMDESNPGFPLAYLLYSPDFVKRSPDAARRFMVAYLRASRDYAAAFGPDRRGTDQVIRDLQANGIAVSPSSVPLSIDPDSKFGFQGVDAFANWLLQEGVIKEKVDLRSYVDEQYREYAVNVLAKP